MTARERVGEALERAEQAAGLGAFWALDRRGALEAAASVDAGGSSGALAGAPVAIKDLVDQQGLPTSAGLTGQPEPAPTDAEVVRRLRGAGAVPIGKTAMDPLGCTTGGQAPGFPPCVNPVDPMLSPGGSSSGSAVAVAAGVVPLALGTDTAGSVRIPAAYCGVVGLKPAWDALPRDGVVPVMPRFDVPGLLGDSVTTCLEGYAAVAGVRVPARVERPLRIALLDDLVQESDPDVARTCQEALSRAALADVVGIELDWRPQGFGAALAHELERTWGERVERDPGRFTDLIRETVAFGRGISAAERDRIAAAFAAASDALAERLERFDAVVCPTVPVAAPAREAESVRVSTSFTRIFNALDWPAISLPAGDVGGAPVGIQVAGPPRRFNLVVEVALRVEAASAGD